MILNGNIKGDSKSIQHAQIVKRKQQYKVIQQQYKVIRMSDKTEVTEIPLNKIKAAPWQPRELFDKDKIKSLGESLKEKGIIQPIVVRKDKTGEGYELIAGERRFRAWSYTGKPTIPAVIKELGDFEAEEMSFIENELRENLIDTERERMTHELWEKWRYTKYNNSQGEMARHLKVTQPTINQRLLSYNERHGKDSLKIEKDILEKVASDDLQITRIIQESSPKAREELLNIRVTKPNLVPQREMRDVVRAIKEVPSDKQEDVVKLISSEKLEPKNVERFVKVLKESPEDIQQKLLKQEITPDEAEEVRIFKTPEQRSQVIEERKIRKEEFAETTKRDVIVRKHMADDIEQGREPTIVHAEFDANEKDEDASAQRIIERYQDIYLRVISFRADHILGIKNAEQQKQCIEIIKKTVAHCNAVLLGVDQLKTIIKYR